jgi:hypothetical protein
MIASEFSLAQIMGTAERELGAFMLAVSETDGPERAREAGDLWLQMLEETGEIANNPQQIFRQTTIRALAELSAEMNERVLLAS